MLTLLQVINRLLALGHSEHQVRMTLNAVANGSIPLTSLFTDLGLTNPNLLMLNRFKEVLPRRDSAIRICVLRSEMYSGD